MKSILVALLLCWASSVYSQSGIIVNSSTEIQVLSSHDVIDIFSGKRARWLNGTEIKVYVLPADSLTTRIFLVEVLGMTPSQFFDILRYDKALGRRTVLVVCASDYDMMNSVSHTAGAIGYVKDITVLSNTNVTIVRVR